MDIAAAKADMRRTAYEARAAVHGAADPAPAHARLLAHIRAVPAIQCVSGYAPIRTEIDPMPALEALHAEGIRICLPVVVAEAAPLVFRAWAPGMVLVPASFGVPIPPEGPEYEPELLITPLLAFDTHGYRLGYGGGYYDRTLELLRARRRSYGVGLAYAGQEVPSVPREPTDQPLDAIITEAATHYPV